MVDVAMAAPAPGSPEDSVLTEGARGDGAPSPATRQGAHGKGVVFVDFGRRRLYAMTDDSDDVSEFDSLVELAEKLKPTLIVVDSLPNKLQKTALEIAKIGTFFLRLKNLEKLSEERKNNGIRKTDENDVKLLKTLYRRQPELFQPLFTSPEELEVRALTELWVELAGQKKSAKRTRTTTNDGISIETHRAIKRLIGKLAGEIHKKSLTLPLYRRAFEELGLKGPALAYIISHDGHNLATLSRDKLVVRYRMVPFHRKRPLRSRILIMMAWACLLHGPERYKGIYTHYRNKGKRHWGAVVRVSKIILRDLHKIARKAGPPA